MDRTSTRRSNKRNTTSSSSSPIGNPNPNSLQSATSEEPNRIIGTCPFMCPAGEMAQRERLGDLSIFEMLNGNPRKTSHHLAVKKFCRSIETTAHSSSDLRPLLILDTTLKYLFNLMDVSDQPFEQVHHFIFDRTRSIRQDLTIQNIANHQAIQMYEQMVEFHIISHHKLRHCNDTPNISTIRYLNMEQLQKCLLSLHNLYEANPSFTHENEAHYRSLYVLLHLNSNTQPTLSLWFRTMPSNIIKSHEMYFARKLLRFFRMGNYRQFLATVVAEASYLQYCIIEPYINEVRGVALSYINHGCYKLHPYPLADLCTVLMMKDSDVESLCECCGLEVVTDEVGNKLLPTKQTRFCFPKEGFKMYCCLGLERYESYISCM